MPMMRKFVLAGAACAALGGTAVIAAEKAHMLNVALPDGSVAQIRYIGDVPPKVVVRPPAPLAPVAMIDTGDPFAMMDRLQAQLAAQQTAMMRQAAAMPTAAPAAPGNVVSYHYVSSTGANGGCTQSVRMTSAGAGAQPKVVSEQSGDCKGMPPLRLTGFAMPTPPKPPAPPAKSVAPIPPAPPKAPLPPV